MSRQRQQGFTLLEIIMVSSILVILALIAFQEKTLVFEQERARALGGELLKYNNAVRDYISFYAGDPGFASKVGTKQGVNWLKLESCGGEIPRRSEANPYGKDEGFLPCQFLLDSAGKTTYGKLSFSTVISSPGEHILKAKTTMSELVLNKRSRGDLAGLAAVVAGSASALNFTPVVRSTDGYAFFCVTEQKSECVGSLNRIIMMASNDSSSDTWLRTDGSNTMNSAITFKPTNSAIAREVRNVASILGLEGENIYIRNNSGESAYIDNGVVIDSDAEIMGILYADKMVDRDNPSFYVDPSGTSRFNDINVEQLVVTKHVEVKGDMHAEGDISTDKNILAKGDISSEGNITAKGDINGANTNLTGGVNAATGKFSSKVTSQKVEVSGDVIKIGGVCFKPQVMQQYYEDWGGLICQPRTITMNIYDPQGQVTQTSTTVQDCTGNAVGDRGFYIGSDPAIKPSSSSNSDATWKKFNDQYGAYHRRGENMSARGDITITGERKYTILAQTPCPSGF
ncbi:prepilin-type N-terminal cleavage/methylation domain-containing protein [Pseudomonas luteola]